MRICQGCASCFCDKDKPRRAMEAMKALDKAWRIAHTVVEMLFY